MKSESAPHLQKLLTDFDVIGLGEGDIDSGLNVLAAMSIALANVSRPGSGIESPGLGRMRVGMSVLVSGSLSASLVTDDVLSEIAIRQNNLSAQLRRLFGDKLAEAKKKGLTAIEFPSGPEANVSESALFQLEQKESLVPLDVVEKWEEVLQIPPNPRIEDLLMHPKVYVAATGAVDLKNQLVGLHAGHPVVALGLSRLRDAAALGDTCTALMDGRLSAGSLGETATGNLLITDPSNLLPEVANNSNDKTAWLDRLLWLVDGDAGPESPGLVEGLTEVLLVRMAERFGTALNRIFAARLNNHDAGSVVHQLDLAETQFRWARFLKSQEKDLPGISGSARGLLATLAFGLIELSRARGFQRLDIDVKGIEALARHLIQRMAHARSAFLFTAEKARRLKDMQRIFRKLGEGPIELRDLYRKLSLYAGNCELILSKMEADGLVRRVDRKWELAEGAVPPDSPQRRQA